MGYNNPNVDPSRALLGRFFLLSLALHLVVFFSWPTAEEKHKTEQAIPVSFLPAPEPKKPAPRPKTPRANTRPSKTPAKIAKRTTPLPEEPAQRPLKPVEPERPEKIVEEPPPLRPEPQPPLQEDGGYAITQRPLPTLKQILPPVTWSAPSRGSEDAIRLDTREPKYISYFTSIKRAIEIVWVYPEPALRNGLQGKLVLEFTILADGQLEDARLLRSSGFSILDEEAVRAVRAAAPFQPIPPWIGKKRLPIIASFEYHDNRLHYRPVP